MNSVIHSTAQIGNGTVIGEFCVIGEGVRIGANCRLGHSVVVHDGVVIGDDVRIDDHATLGKRPMRSINSATTVERDLSPLEIGAGCIIGTSVVLYRGATIGPRVLVADLATIREDVSIGEGTIVGRGVAIENQTRVGRFCKLETESYICAYSELGDRVFVAPGVVTSNDNFMGRTKERHSKFKGVTVRRGGRLGAASITLPGVVVESDGVVGAGGVATRNVPARTIVVGTPARRLRDVPIAELAENQEGWNES